MMKVLQITTNYPTEKNPIFGIFMKEQVESLEQFGVKNTILFSNGSETGIGRKHGGMWIHLKTAIKLTFHLLTHRYDIIHCHSGISGLILFCSGGAFFKKCILSFQNDPEKDDAKLFKLLYPFFNHIIVKKPFMLDNKKIIYLPNGCNMDFFKPKDKVECKKELGFDQDKRYVLFMDSNATKKRTQKRKDRFDEVMRILAEKYGYTNLQKLVMTKVPRNLVPTYMNASDIHLMTSDLEGSPNSVKECMCCNVPVVSTPVGNVKDLFEGVSQCFVSKNYDATELADLMHKALSIKEPINTRQSIIDKKLDIKSVGETLYNIYVQTIKGE